MKARKKIGFVVISPPSQPLASTRIAVLNMLRYLRDASYSYQFLFASEFANPRPRVDGLAEKMLQAGVDIAFFQKVHGESVLREARALSRAGVPSAYAGCDIIDNDMAEVCAATLAITDYVKDLYLPHLRPKIHVVHDGIEKPELYKKHWTSARRGSRMRAVLVNSQALNELPVIGTPPSSTEVLVVGKYPMADTLHGRMRDTWWTVCGKASVAEKRAALQWWIRRPFRKVNWTLETVYDTLVSADLGIIPVEPATELGPGLPVPWWKMSSENRLTLKMSVALPVIASPVPAYLPIIEHGLNGYIAHDREEFLDCLTKLRDPAKREAMGRNARETVLPRYSMEEQARQFIEVLDSLT